jgi:chitinase
MVYNKTAGVIVTCDDARSLAMKCKLIKDMGLRGFAMWEAAGDYYDDILIDSIRKAFGFKT